MCVIIDNEFMNVVLKQYDFRRVSRRLLKCMIGGERLTVSRIGHGLGMRCNIM